MSQRDISEKIKNLYNVDISDGSAIFYCFDVSVLGLSIDDNMRCRISAAHINTVLNLTRNTQRRS